MRRYAGEVGIALLLLGLVMPAGTLFVAGTDWPGGVKTLVSGILLAGLEDHGGSGRGPDGQREFRPHRQ